MPQDKLLISITNKDVFVKMKKMRGFCSKTIEIMFEYIFSKTDVEILWNKFYLEGLESYKKFILDIINGEKTQEDNTEKEPKKEVLNTNMRKKRVKVESSLFWQ